MNADQNADFKMMMDVKSVCGTFVSDWNGTPSFKIPYNKLLAQVLNVLPQALAQQGQTSTGVTTDKKTARTAVEGLILPIAGAIEAYAATTANASLQKLAHLTSSGLQTLADVALIGQAERIATLANDNLSNLGAYGITAARITALRNTGSTFSGWMGKPQEALDQKKGGTAWLQELRQTGHELLNLMDAQMVLFQALPSDFYQQYFFARRITPPSYRRRAIVFNVRDAAGHPIVGATISMEFLPKDKRTGATGTCYLNTFPAGVYNGEVRMNGYVAKTFQAAVNDGLTTRVEVVLLKA